MLIHIDWACFLNNSGYSQAAQDYILALNQSRAYDIRITCFHKDPLIVAFGQKTLEQIKKMLNKPFDPHAIQIYHCIPDIQRKIGKLTRSIGFATYETYQPPQHWITKLNNMDAIICPSLFNVKTFAHAGITRPIFHIPHIIDAKKWNDKVLPLTKYDEFTFIFVGAWKRRKSWSQLIEAWFREFSENDNVRLVIKTEQHASVERDIDNIKRNIGIHKKFCPITIDKRILSDDSLPSLYRSADCFILPTLGEGFCLPPLQSMALKIPVIITNFSGCQDYALPELCTLIEPSGYMRHDCMDNIPQFKDKTWPRITIESVQKSMRYVLSNPEIIKNKAIKAYNMVHENYNYKSGILKFTDMINSVYNKSVSEEELFASAS